MPKKPTNLLERNGRYYARLVVPKSLREIVGKRELTAALGADRSKAAKLLPRLIADMQSQLSAAQNQSQSQARVVHQLVVRANKPLSRRQFASAHYVSELNIDRAERFSEIRGEDGESIELTDMTPFRPAYEAVLMKVASGRANTEEADATIGWAIDEFRKRGNTALETGSSEWRILAAELAAVHLEALRRISERETGLFNDQSSHPLLNAPEPLPIDPVNARMIGPESGKTLAELLPEFLKERNASQSTNYEHGVTVRIFEESQGDDLPVYRITRQHVRAFRNALSDTPTNYSKRFPGKSLPEAIKLNNARLAPFPKLSAKTINDKYLSKLHTFFAWAVSNDIVPDNPVAGIKLDATNSEAGRVDFKPQDLVRIFASEVFSETLAEAEWAALISLFSGLRASELAQIKLDGVRHERGILVFAIEESTKNKGSQRLVPVHSKLIELGIEKRVKMLRSNGATHLFPVWYRKGMEAKDRAKNGSGAATLNHYFPRFIPKVFNTTHLPNAGINDKRKSWHSFRHTFKTGLSRAGVVKGVRDDLCGHRDYSAGAAYVHETSVEAMRDAVEKLHFDGLDLSHLK